MTIRRPLVALAAILAGGSLVGLELRAASAPAWVVPAVAVGLVLALGLGLRLLAAARPSGDTRPAALPLWIALVLAATVTRAGWTSGHAGPLPAPAPGELAAARAQVCTGRWRTQGSRGHAARDEGRAGWIEPVLASEAPGVRLLLAPEASAPKPGSWVALLPGGEVIPWPRGPVPGPRARAGRFHALSTVHPSELVVVAEPTTSAAMRQLERGTEVLARWYASLAARATERFGRGPHTGLMKAILLGDRSDLSFALGDLFRRTGTRHLLAVSGLHVGLVIGLLLLPVSRAWALLVGRAWPRWRAAAALTAELALLAIYAGLVGGGQPVTRATLAFGLALIAPHLSIRRPGHGPRARRPDALSLVAFAACLECVIDPASVHSVSLQLSYLATLGLLLGAAPVTALFAAGHDRSHGHLNQGLHGTLAIVAAATKRILARAVGASIAAVIATLPVVWDTFGEWSPLGIIATPVALPLVAWMLAAGWMTLLLPDVLSPLWVSLPADALLGWLELVDRCAGTPSPLPLRPAPLLWFAALTSLAGVRLRSASLRRLACASWALILLPWSAAPSRFELHALDVGHGTCIVARAPGVPAIVFDAGSRDRRRVYEEALAPLLAQWEVRRPVVVLSHDHRDHRSALGFLLTRYPPRLWGGARVSWPRAARIGKGTPLVDLTSGRARLPLGDTPLRATLIRGSTGTGNEGSRSLELAWGRVRVLLTGDAEADGLAATLSAESAGLAAGAVAPLTLLVLPHHGSETPHLGRLLEHWRPAIIWVSGAESPPVADELDRRGLDWHMTAESGPLSVSWPPDSPSRTRETAPKKGNPDHHDS